ncbi:MAG TPA: TolC family protein [Nitrospiraceae bacterium]|nr:TolC family protein [Nitrospiraceae bacterium]
MLALIVSASNSASASDPSLTLDQAIRRGLEGHPLIRIFQHEVLETEAATRQIEAANYPRLTGVYANSGGNTRVLANLGISGSLPKPVNYLTTPGVRVDYLITDFGHTAHKILANKALAASAEKNVLTTKAIVILSVEQAYLNCLKQQQLLTVAQQVFKERDLIRVQTELFRRNNLRSKLDLDFAAIEANRAELAVITAQNDLKTAFATLSHAMGLRLPERFALEDVPFHLTPARPIDPLVQEALSKRPELLGSHDRIRATDEALKAARALNFGTVTAIGTAGYTWWSREERPSGKEVSNPGAQLGFWGAAGTSSIPLYAGGRIQGQIEEAEARKDEVHADTRAIANDVVLEVARAYFSRLTAEQHIKVAEEKVAHAREAFALARERYKAGLGSILDVTTATADLLSAEVGVAEARYDYRASDAALAYATGAEYSRY